MGKKGTRKEVDALGQVLEAVQGLDDDAQKKWVFASAMSNLGFECTAAPPPLSKNSPLPPSRVAGAGETDTPKGFLKAKNPQSDVQRVACLAYYLTHHRGQPHFKTKELKALNVEAAGLTIGNASRAVDNATKQNRYLAPAGGGKKQITVFGEEVVEALPDQAGVKAVEQKKPKRRKAGTRKAASKR